MKVIIRADASTEIGTGHVARCLTLAKQLLARGHSVRFLSREHPGHLHDYLWREGLETIALKASASLGIPAGYARWLGVSQADDAQETCVVLEKTGSVDWVIVDHYGIDAEWERQIRAIGPRILVVDDLAERGHCCDLLLDQNRLDGSFDYRGLCPENCQTLLGPRYALLREEFRDAHALARVRQERVSRIFVFYGGIDATNDTAKAIQALALVAPSIPADVVAGKGNPHLQELNSLVGKLPNGVLHVETSRMAELMSAGDLALGAGGTATWERACVGLPALITAIADNQVFIGRQAEHLGLGRYLGASAAVDVPRIAHALEVLLKEARGPQEWSNAALALVDGNGAERAVMRMEAVSEGRLGIPS